MFTRDSKVWWLVIAGGVLATLTADPSIVNDLVSGDRQQMAQAVVKLLGLIVIAAGGVSYKSPFNISPEGRVKEMEKKAASMTEAERLTLLASEKADAAMAMTKDSARTAEAAKDATETAANP
jgi:hypothetical protein